MQSDSSNNMLWNTHLELIKFKRDQNFVNIPICQAIFIIQQLTYITP